MNAGLAEVDTRCLLFCPASLEPHTLAPAADGDNASSLVAQARHERACDCNGAIVVGVKRRLRLCRPEHAALVSKAGVVDEHIDAAGVGSLDPLNKRSDRRGVGDV
eukprot:361033-Chlamydomonas_euryale.AAC.2